MIAKLALRNVRRFLFKRIPLLLILATTVAAMYVGNTLLELSRTGLETTYSKSLSGDFSVSAVDKEGFTLFGSELPLIGEYRVIPSLPNAETWKKKLATDPNVRSVVGVVAAQAVMEVFEYRTPTTLFGVEFNEYFTAFPTLTLTKGELPRPGERAILINEELYQRIARTRGVESPMNSIVSLIIFNDQTFTIRQAKISGVFRYPVSDEMLNRVVLADADTARAINGYTVGSSLDAHKTVGSGTSAGDLDALFDTDAADVMVAGAGGVDSGTVEQALADHTQRDLLNQSVAGSWNFLLVHTEAGKLQDVVKTCTEVGSTTSLQVRTWQETVGGIASLVSFLSLAFNIGVLLVGLGAMIVVVNAVGLSVVERAQELGTMRALGASRGDVVMLIGLETLLFVGLSGAAGIALGFLALVILSGMQVALSNPFLSALFGSGYLDPRPDLWIALGHLGVFLAAGLAGALQPALMSLRIAPARAMAAQ